MPSSIPLSLRISSEDAAFLAELEISGAKTPSEKVRAILAAARKQHRGSKDISQCLEIIQDMTRPALTNLRAAQADLNIRSDFIVKLYEKIPEILAELVAAEVDTGKDAKAQLKALEVALATEVFGFIEEVINMGLTSRSRTYDHKLIRNHMEPIIEIVELQKISKQKEI